MRYLARISIGSAFVDGRLSIVPMCTVRLDSDPPHGKKCGMNQDRQIHKKVSILDVIDVVLYVLVNEVCAVSTELPETGEAWFHLQALPVRDRVLRDDERHFRSRTYQ